MVRFVDAVILFSGRLDDTVAFYRSLGIPLEQEEHEAGPVHYAATLGRTHLAIYESGPGDAPGRRDGGCTQIGFQLDDLEGAVDWMRASGATILVDLQEVPWGRRAVVLDPDGRPVELNQGGTMEQSGEFKL